PAGMRRVGVLHPGQTAVMTARIAAIREGLSERDSRRASEIELLVRLADGDLTRLPTLAADLVGSGVDIILAAGPPAVQAARGETSNIPIVALDLETDPVASGLVTSLAHPG